MEWTTSASARPPNPPKKKHQKQKTLPDVEDWVRVRRDRFFFFFRFLSFWLLDVLRCIAIVTLDSLGWLVMRHPKQMIKMLFLPSL